MGTDINDDISEAVEFNSSSWLSSSESVISQDDIKKHEVHKKHILKVEGLPFMGDREAKVVTCFERGKNFT